MNVAGFMFSVIVCLCFAKVYVLHGNIIPISRRRTMRKA